MNHISMIVAMMICIILSAYFSATETAFSSLNRTRLRTIAEKGNRRAVLSLHLCDKYDKLLSTILIGNNIVNILVASLGTVLFVELYGNKGATISTVVVTIVVLIFGEISPKSLAKENPEKFSMFSAPLINLLMIVFTPLTLLFTGLKKLLAKLLKTDSNRKVTQEELLMFVDEVEQGGSINENEGSLLRSAIEFNDVQVEDILTHRVDIEAVDVDESKDEIAKIFTESGHSRLPVYEETIDDIIGIIHHKDFYTDGGITEHSVREIMTKPIFIPPTLKISNLLKLLQKEKTYMAVVKDEYGGTLGIVTMEDILEELVGEIWDEHDEIVENVRKLGENNYDINCAMDLDEFFDMFDITDETDSSTLNGWVMEHLGRIPDVGDKFSAHGLEITIKAADGRRVNEINVVHTPVKPEKGTK